jgi:hypothetical protein
MWTVVVVASIYATLGVSPEVAAGLRAEGLLAATFGLGVVLVGATAAYQGLRARPGGTEIVVALGIAAVYILVLTRIALVEERTHLIEYGVVAVFIHEALLERGGRPVSRAAPVAVAAASAVGAVDEAIQGVLPTRVFDPVDIVFNVVAATMAVTASVVLSWARRRRRRR